MEGTRGRKKGGDWFDGYGRVESEGLTGCGMQQGSASGGTPSVAMFYAANKVAAERMKLYPTQVKAISHAFGF